MRKLALVLVLASTTAYADSKAWTAAKSLIPSGMEMVGGVNAANLRSSKLYETMLPLAMMNASEAKDQIDQIKKLCVRTRREPEGRRRGRAQGHQSQGSRELRAEAR
jgi:hypothetical protein